MKIIVQNHNSGSRTFGELGKTYSDLAYIPGGTFGKRALVVDIEEEDFEKVVETLFASQVSAKRFEELSEGDQKTIEKIFPAALADEGEGGSERLRSFLTAEYKKLFKLLDKGKQSELKDFNPKNASTDDLTKKREELSAYLMNLLASRDQWSGGFARLPKADGKELFEALKKDIYEGRSAFKPDKAGLDDLKKALEGLEIIQEDIEKRAKQLEEGRKRWAFMLENNFVNDDQKRRFMELLKKKTPKFDPATANYDALNQAFEELEDFINEDEEKE